MRNGLPSNNTNNNNNRNRNRNRNNGGGGGGGSGRPQNSNSYRPDNRGNNDRVRGNANQLMEKYKNLARDAASAGDRVLGEYYMQHADHYFRVLAEFRARYEETRPREQRQDDNESQGDNSGENRSDDQVLEGVDTVDLAAAAGFGAAASMATFGADGPPNAEPSHQISESVSNNDDGGEQNSADEQERQNPRRIRSRGRPRKVDADPVEG